MGIKREIVTVFQLLGLLILLFWSLTWNLPPDFDGYQSSRKKFSQKASEKSKGADVDLQAEPFLPTWNKYAIILDSYKTVKHLNDKNSRDSTADDSTLPSFNAWKEVELTKRGRVEVSDQIPEKSRSRRRKLNYASSKCGAKILASNPEAKYRMSILNEKVDEYMLNPCIAKTWFIVELCDTIEATQIELVNYELYSSTPKDFIVFWNDVYPTQTWHHLGTFEAKDQRVIQSFDLSTRNLGKFIKVAIWSHYGKEHYCPLSVFRILGYSMVYEYDDIEMQSEENKVNKKTEESGNQVLKEDTNSVNRISPLQAENETEPITPKSTSFLLEMHQQKRYLFCSDFKYLNLKKKCLNTVYCLFLQRTVLIRQTCQRKGYGLPTHHASAELLTSNSHNPQLMRNPNSGSADDLLTTANFSIPKSGSRNNRRETTKNTYSLDRSKIPVNISRFNSVDSASLNQINETINDNSTSRRNSRDSKTNLNVMKKDHKQQQHKDIKDHTFIPGSESRCKCGKDSKSSEIESEMFQKEHLPHDESAESAALIQKESVIVKLTMRIKSSEINLNLINGYLQELSEYYRKQMEDMQNMFNGTVKALRDASEKAATIDRQQQVSIEHLEYRMSTLNKKVDFLTQGQEGIWKQVLELHGFFLIMEFIIMSTIFSIFLNKIKKNNICRE